MMIEKNENINIWERNLFNSIKDISDIDMQNKLWIGKDQNFVSSYSEIISVLYDDFDFERYIEYYKTLSRNEDLLLLLLDLNHMINTYEKKETEEQILVDSNWIAITNKAKDIISVLKKKSF